MVGLSLGEKHFIQGGIAHDLRCDGRKRLTYRPILVETGVIPQANGSARVRMGATDVIASIKAELGSQACCNLTKEKSLYILIAVRLQSQPLRVEGVMNWQQSCQMLFKTVSWVVKVEQVLELTFHHLLWLKEKFVGIFTLMGLLLVQMEICWML
ncbi:hypothetical protein VIGAN_04268300 [Vigna angularis var. angularis]|uniref:Ribosomal RNA-processing protein 42 n=1 Tax=Vigna angularis var. angularis TaxID=157739 RepID=A0A0S3RXA3_PHAAN|nr:hypothetical protein VIGAN_04268300 [Vigna angularis var. angularis]